MKYLNLSFLFFVALYSFESKAAATINVTFENTSYGSWTQQAKNAFLHAMHIWEQSLNSTQIVHVKAKWEDLALKESNNNYASVLGYAKPTTTVKNFGSNDSRYFSDVYYPISLAEKLRSGEISSQQFPYEIECSFNSNGVFDWYFGTDGNCPNTKYDLVTTILHEIGHGIGFYSSAAMTDMFTPGTPYAGFQNLTIYDVYIRNSFAEKPLDFINNPTTNFNAQSTNYLTSNDLYFTGNSATWNMTWDNSMVYPKIYAPNPWDNGSSISHFDETFFNVSHPNSGEHLMTPYTNNGESHHNPGWVGEGLLTDIGWDGTLYLSDKININDFESSISVYPNPFMNVINITSDSYEVIHFSIYASNGVKVYSKKFSGEVSIDLSMLESGVYYIVSQTKSENQFFNKLIKY